VKLTVITYSAGNRRVRDGVGRGCRAYVRGGVGLEKSALFALGQVGECDMVNIFWVWMDAAAG